MNAEYWEVGHRVSTFTVHTDERELGLERVAFPALSATYVLLAEHEGLLDAIYDDLAKKPFEFPTDTVMDEFGHLAFGPIPVLNEWAPVESEITGPILLASAQATAVIPFLIGGGWLVLADRSRKSGVLLVPLGWRAFSKERAEAHLRKELGSKFELHILSKTVAIVWDVQLSAAGLSYHCLDDSGRLRHVGAIWQDCLGQTWEVRYFFGPDDRMIAERLVCGLQ